jgi:phosphoribosylformimino-5-aminoimidazole carboxamide ribotide isomerase
MQVIPAIDLRQGRCVRLFQGDPGQQTTYSDDPVRVARRWEDEGATLLHVVDLDGAFAGSPRNLAVIREVCQAVAIPVEVGGGLREIRDMESALEAGARRIILGSSALREEVVLETLSQFGPDRVVAGLDARSGRAAVDGWVRTTELSALDLALTLREVGIKEIIYTDIRRDGTLSGPNLEELGRMATTGLRIIASGGVSRLQDIRDLAAIPGVVGVIVGKALYDGALSLQEAIAEAVLVSTRA